MKDQEAIKLTALVLKESINKRQKFIDETIEKNQEQSIKGLAPFMDPKMVDNQIKKLDSWKETLKDLEVENVIVSDDTKVTIQELEKIARKKSKSLSSSDNVNQQDAYIAKAVRTVIDLYAYSAVKVA